MENNPKTIIKQNKTKNVIPNLFRNLLEEPGKESTPSDNQSKHIQDRHPEVTDIVAEGEPEAYETGMQPASF